MKRKEIVELVRLEIARRNKLQHFSDASYYRNDGALDALDEILELLTRA